MFVLDQKNKMKKYLQYYLPFLLVIIIITADFFYTQNKQNKFPLTYQKETDYNSVRFWDSVKVMHDSRSDYIPIRKGSEKVFLTSTIRSVEPKYIREDSMLIITLSEDSMKPGNKQTIFRCFYIGPLDSSLFKISNRVRVYGYAKQDTLRKTVYIKADFIEKNTLLTQAGRLGLSNQIVLVLLVFITLLVFIITILIIRNEK